MSWDDVGKISKDLVTLLLVGGPTPETLESLTEPTERGFAAAWALAHDPSWICRTAYRRGMSASYPSNESGPEPLR